MLNIYPVKISHLSLDGCAQEFQNEMCEGFFFEAQYGVLMNIPQRIISLEFPEILSQNLICYHWLSVSGNSAVMHCGILFYTLAFVACDSITCSYSGG